jgi:NAD(P)-dependent dehydrogenase (short-subunit alcohol dehydrogenase family)
MRHYMINLYGPTLTGQAFARLYIKAKAEKPDGPGGRIVNISSQAAHVALDYHGAYCASKAGLQGLTKCQANEWAKHGITSNTVSPGPVWTALGKKAWADDKVREE